MRGSALRACLDGGAARWVVIRGEPGIGKSRLLQEIGTLARAGGARAVQRGRARLRPGARRGGAACAGRRPAAAAGAWPMRRLLGAAPGRGRPGRRRSRRMCSRCSAMPCPTPCAPPMPRWTARRASAAAPTRWWRCCAGACAGGAVLLALEDLHWAEAPVLALLARVAAGCRDRPLLLAVTTRPQSERFDAARRAHAAELPALTLDLSALGQADAQSAGAAPGAATMPTWRGAAWPAPAATRCSWSSCCARPARRCATRCRARSSRWCWRGWTGWRRPTRPPCRPRRCWASASNSTPGTRWSTRRVWSRWSTPACCAPTTTRRSSCTR